MNKDSLIQQIHLLPIGQTGGITMVFRSQVLDTIRQHQAAPSQEVVERVARIFQDHTTNYPGAKISEKSRLAAKAAIAVMSNYAGGQPEAHWTEPSDSVFTAPVRMGDACNSEPPAPNQQREILVVEPFLRLTKENGDEAIFDIKDGKAVYSGVIPANVAAKDFMDALLNQIEMRSPKPVSVSLEKCKDAVTNLPGYYDAHDDVIKAVLDAAGVKYVK